MIFSIMSLLSFASWSKLQGTGDDDWVDRASHIYTVLLLCVFSVIVSSAQYVGEPIHCWTPAQFPSKLYKFPSKLYKFPSKLYKFLSKLKPIHCLTPAQFPSKLKSEGLSHSVSYL
jgi:hypothetical protein